MKIAIVGNGKLSKKYGKNIDKCDLVIRFNKAKIKGYEDYIGYKTDILSIVNETSLSYQNAVKEFDRYIISNISNILVNGRKRNDNYEKAILSLKGNGNIIFTYIGYEYFHNLCGSLFSEYKPGKNPSTGLNTIAYMIACNNQTDNGDNEYRIYGFDGFKSGHYFNDNIRNNEEFHPIDMEMAVLNKLSEFKNIKFFN